MDLKKYKANIEDPIVKLREKDPVTESKIPNWSTIHGTLADGNEIFISLPDSELEKAEEKDGYVNLKGLAVIKHNKIGKMYLEPLVEKPEKATGFSNPWATKS